MKKSTQFIPAARFAILAQKPAIRLAKGQPIIVQSEPHPESGEVAEVELKSDGEFFLVDGLQQAERKLFPLGAGHVSVVTGAMSWRDVSAHVLRYLNHKESEIAHKLAAAEDSAFIHAAKFGGASNALSTIL
jgi:hypothetical protein